MVEAIIRPAGRQAIGFYVDNGPANLVSSIPAIDYARVPREISRLMHMKIDGLRAGDALVVSYQIVATWDMGYSFHCEFSCGLVLTNQPTGNCNLDNYDFEALNGGPLVDVDDTLRFIGRWPGENVQQIRHHAEFTATKAYVVPEVLEPGDYWVALMGYCGRGLQGNGREPLALHDGDMSVVHYR